MTTNLQVRLKNAFKALFGRQYSIYSERNNADGSHGGGHTMKDSLKEAVLYAMDLESRGYTIIMTEITPNGTIIDLNYKLEAMKMAWKKLMAG
jgi:hypothetical protein